MVFGKGSDERIDTYYCVQGQMIGIMSVNILTLV